MNQAITLSSAWLGTVVLLSLRLGAVLLFTPLLAAGSVPGMVRVLLVLGFAVALTMGAPAGLAGSAVPAGLIHSPGQMISAALVELGLGGTLALNQQARLP